MPVEFDFLGLERTQRQQEQQLPSDSKKLSSIRDLQNAASRLNPNFLKSIISQPTGPQPAPVSPSPVKTAPLTIFYNGTISYFEATAEVVANLMKMAEEGKIQLKHKQEIEQPQPPNQQQHQQQHQHQHQQQHHHQQQHQHQHQHQHQQRGILMERFNTDSNGDMPLYRKKSLQRFFEKRKERLTSAGPYPTSSYSSVGDVDEYVNQKLANKNKMEQSKSFSSSSSTTTPAGSLRS